MKTTSAITTFLARTAAMLLLALTTCTSAWAKEFITDVLLIGGSKSEVSSMKSNYTKMGWKFIDKDLNDGCGATSDYIYLLYKTADNFSDRANLTFITGFYLTNESGQLDEHRSFNGLPYHLVPYDGGSHFKSVQGNLNSNCILGSADIHLYYTTFGFDSKEAVYEITFNEYYNGNGVVGKNGNNSEGYDLNAGCGKLSDYIYMHCNTTKSNYWTIRTSSDLSQCYIKGFDSTGMKDSIKAVPAIINGAVVTDIYGVSPSSFDSLKTIYFTDAFQPTEMLSAKNCTKLTNVHVVDNSGTVIRKDELPASIKSIPDNAFRNTKIKNLKIPYVTSIGKEAFSGCDSLKSITIPTGVTSIEYFTFNGCSSLTSINIPNNVTSVGEYAFNGCSSLTSVTIGNGLDSLDQKIFADCNALNSITVTSGNPTYDSRDNCNAIIEKSTNTLIAGCKNTVIPNSVTSIGKYAFYYSTSLTSINIPNSVTSIGDYAFCGCTSLTSINLPNSVTSIGDDAFRDCPILASFTIPNSVTSISDETFYGCTGLKSVTIPNSVTSIGGDAFQNCSSLTSVTIPNSVTSIGGDAFRGCTEIIDVYCFADPLALIWNYNDNRYFDKNYNLIVPGPADFMPNKQTKIHVFNANDWSDFVNNVNAIFVGDLILDLADNASNEAFLNTWNGRKVNVTLQGRTLHKKGQWNSLCLPFGINDFTGTPLDGATVMTFDDASFNKGTLTLNFKDTTAIEAGKPYFVKWPMGNYNEFYFSNPTFYDVTISKAAPSTLRSSDGTVSIKGCYAPVTLEKGDLTKLFVGTNSGLFHPRYNTTVNAFRSWIELASPITTVGDVNGDRTVSVTDVTSLVNHLTSGNDKNFVEVNADVSGDGNVSGADVAALAKLLVSNVTGICNVVIKAGDSTISYAGGGDSSF